MKEHSPYTWNWECYKSDLEKGARIIIDNMHVAVGKSVGLLLQGPRTHTSSSCLLTTTRSGAEAE